MFHNSNTIIKIHVFILVSLTIAALNIISKSDNTSESSVNDQPSSHHRHLFTNKNENISPLLLFSNKGDRNK